MSRSALWRSWALLALAFAPALLAQEPPARSSGDELGLARVNAFLKEGQTLERALRPLVRDARRAVLEVREAEARIVAFATLLDDAGHVLTKASVLPTELSLRAYDGTDHGAQVLGIDEESDLALLKIEPRGLSPLPLFVEDEFAVGQILVSVSGRIHPLGVGVTSVAPRRIPAESGFLGVSFEDGEAGVRVTQVVPESSAEKHGVRVDDVLRAIDDTEVASGNEFQRTIARKAPGTRIKLRVQRAAETLDVSVVLGARETGQPESLEGERSVRRAGFSRALQHDTVIAPWQCGGPVLDSSGRCIAINIARAGRTSTLAIPAADAQRVLQKLLAPAAPTAAPSNTENQRRDR
ncbi:MAG: PDZ domain-containing protein [Planctomycetes bacterium]|nr:PDZ domain-containing protein [Planctomycetota bacterium]